MLPEILLARKYGVTPIKGIYTMNRRKPVFRIDNQQYKMRNDSGAREIFEIVKGGARTAAFADQNTTRQRRHQPRSTLLDMPSRTR